MRSHNFTGGCIAPTLLGFVAAHGVGWSGATTANLLARALYAAALALECGVVAAGWPWARTGVLRVPFAAQTQAGAPASGRGDVKAPPKHSAV